MSFKNLLDFPVSEGEVAVMWYNSYSGVAVKFQHLLAVFDPVSVGVEQLFADVVIVTHEDNDHFDAKLVKDLQKRTAATVVTTPYIAQQLRGLPEDSVKGLKIGQSFTINGVNIHGEYSAHPGRQPLSFVIATESIAIYNPDDSDPFPEMDDIRRKYHPDVLLDFGLWFDKAVEVAKLVRPEVVVAGRLEPRELMEKFKQNLKAAVPEARAVVVRRFEIYKHTPGVV